VFDHVAIRVSDRDASERFYETVFATIGIARTASDDAFVEWDDWSIAQAEASEPVTRGLHVGFGAESRGHVDAFWRAGVDAGFESDGEPGPRTEFRRGVDHLWIRVADVAASKRFYEEPDGHTIELVGRYQAPKTEPGKEAVSDACDQQVSER
jgi:catechol 2,3-dioxygenase-like lactoylglutathione lyase family enzyme